MHSGDRRGGVTSTFSSSSSEDSDSRGYPPLPFHRLAGGTLDLLSFFLRLHFLLRARFASCLTVSLGKLTPHGTLWAPQDLA
jgi:hypothetical protein